MYLSILVENPRNRKFCKGALVRRPSQNNLQPINKLCSVWLKMIPKSLYLHRVKRSLYVEMFLLSLSPHRMSGDTHWFHQDTSMSTVFNDERVLSGDPSWTFELRVRYCPADLSDLYDKDKVSFTCYFNQVKTIMIHVAFMSKAFLSQNTLEFLGQVRKRTLPLL